MGWKVEEKYGRLKKNNVATKWEGEKDAENVRVCRDKMHIHE